MVSQSLASQNSILSRILLEYPYPKTNILHVSPPYLPIRGIPLPLLKYIIYVLSLDVQIFCFVPLIQLMRKWWITHDLLNLDKYYLVIACLICKHLMREGTNMSAQFVKDNTNKQVPSPIYE